MTVSRRIILAGAAGTAAAALLAACGGSTATDTPKPAQPTTAATTGGGTAATTAPTTAAGSAAATRPAGSATSAPAGTTVPSGTTAAGTTTTSATAAAGTGTTGTGATGTTAASTGTGTLKPKTGADAFKGKKLSYFQKVQYYKAVQDGIGKDVSDYTKSVGADVDLSLQSTDPGPNVQKVQAGVQAGQPFDLADDIGVSPQQLITLGVLTDVSDFTKQLVDAYGTLMPIVPPGLQQNGKFWAVPFFTSSDAWFLRKDWCAAKGIDPSSIDTYEKARDAALAISDPSKNQFGWGFSPYAVGDGPQLITHVVHSYGGSIQDKTGTKVVWNSPETVAGITFLADIYTNSKYKNMLSPGYESWDGSGNNNAWLAGTVGMTANAFTLYAKSHDDKNPVFDKTYVLQRPKGPAVKEALRGGQLGFFYIPKGAKNADLAMETIKYIMQPDQWFAIAKNGGGLILPAYESQWKNDYWKSDPNFAQLEGQVRDPTGYNQTYYPGPVSPGVDGVIANKVLENMMAQIIQKGQKVPDAVKDAHDAMVKIYEQFGLKQ
jgi:multiple sugar transport system substrate-binding protein